MASEPAIRRKSVNQIQAQTNRIVAYMIGSRRPMRTIDRILDINERYIRNATNTRQYYQAVGEGIRTQSSYEAAIAAADNALIPRSRYMRRNR